MTAEMLTETFVVDRLPRQVWDALELPPETGCVTHVPALGGEVTLLERDPERLVRFACADPPCEIQLRFEPVTAAGWPTRVVAGSTQASASGPEREDRAERWRLYVAELQLWLAHEVTANASGASALGLAAEDVGYGLRVSAVAVASPFVGAGLQDHRLRREALGEQARGLRGIAGYSEIAHRGVEEPGEDRRVGIVVPGPVAEGRGVADAIHPGRALEIGRAHV